MTRTSRSFSTRLVASAVTSAVTLALLAPTTSALAADKQACLAAYEQTQKLKKSGQLLEAKRQALICAQDGCPASLRDDCTGWTVELDKNTPSITLLVTDDEGHDVTDATAYVDGKPVTAHVEGKAIALDPGTHKIRVERAGEAPIEQDIVAHEGDKNRSVTVKFPAKAKPAASTMAPVTTSPEPAAPASTSRPIPTGTWIFGGIALVGIVGFTVFGLSGVSQKSDLDGRGCKPACPQSDVDKAKTSFLIADISLGVAVVGATLAAVFYATRGEEPAPGPKAGRVPSVGFTVGAKGGSATLGWTF